MGFRTTLVSDHFRDSMLVLERAAQSKPFLDSIHHISELCVTALNKGGKLLFAGNGGSAADAQHIAGEFVSRLNFDRGPLAAMALTTDTSVITAVGNDYGYEQIFERQVRGLGRAGDVFVGISTSGRSPNVIRALSMAKSMGITTVGFGGEDAGDMGPLCDATLQAPSRSTPLIQQIHIVAAHAICGFVEEALFGAQRTPVPS